MMQKKTVPRAEIVYDYTPNLHDVYRYYENFTHKGKTMALVGNDEARVLTPIIFGLEGISIVVKGASGSGKSTLVKCAGQMLWGDEVFLDKVPEVLYMAGASKRGWLTNSLAERIKNVCTHAIAPELQNVIVNNDVAEALIKLWTEGECYTYFRAEEFGKTVKKLTLEPLPILTSIATENPVTQKLGEEMERRFFPLYTIASRDLNEKIHQRKAEMWSMPEDVLQTMSENEKTDLRLYLQDCMKMSIPVKNPSAMMVRGAIPHYFVVSDSMIERFFETIAAITRFFHVDRMIYKKGSKEYLLSTPADNWYGFFLAGEPLALASMNIPDLGKEIINILPQRDETFPDISMTTNDIVDELSALGFERTKRQVEQILKTLEAVNYAKKDERTKDSYFRTKTYKFDRQIDWPTCVKKTADFVRTAYPEISKEYIDRFCTEPEVKHPFLNTKIKLLDIEPNAPEVLDITEVMKTIKGERK